MSSRIRPLLWGCGFGLLVMVGLMLMADISALRASLETFDGGVLVPVCGIVLAGYGVRTVKWHYYLRRLGMDVSVGESTWIFFSGLIMAISPMKVGEVLKSFMLKRRHGIAISRSAPIVLAERLTDVLALVVLAGVGSWATGVGGAVVGICAAIALTGVAVLTSPRLSAWMLRQSMRLPLLRKASLRLHEALASTQRLLTPGALLWTTFLSLIAWGGEGVGAWLIVEAFTGVEASLGEVAFIFSFATLAGAFSMLPGGLLATEGSMIGLFVGGFAIFGSTSMATAATLLIRFCTLWFAVLLGAIAFGSYQRWRPADP